MKRSGHNHREGVVETSIATEPIAWLAVEEMA
jgi:hypothetical protein